MQAELKKYTNIGGQAVIEGVMMRSPHFFTIAVRKPDHRIVMKELLWKGYAERFPFLKKPFLRGICTLIESMVNGIGALSFSANIAATSTQEKKTEELSTLAIFTSIFLAFIMGMLLFVALPHFITMYFSKQGLFSQGTTNPIFHLVDGLIKVIFLVSYVYAIAWMKDIKRVFQYHGAEHKSIYTFENGEELTVANARKYSTLHPRCGTSFLLFLLIISILVFSIFFPLFGSLQVSSVNLINQVFLILIKIILMFPIAGMSYEFIRLSANHINHPFFRALIFPGLMLQKLTTREPTDDQLEIALASLRRVLLLEKTPSALSQRELEFSSLLDIAPVHATISEFPG